MRMHTLKSNNFVSYSLNYFYIYETEQISS